MYVRSVSPSWNSQSRCVIDNDLPLNLCMEDLKIFLFNYFLFIIPLLCVIGKILLTDSSWCEFSNPIIISVACFCMILLAFCGFHPF